MTDRPANAPLDLPAIRRRLASATGKAFWRSLEELAEAPEFEQYLREEFPRGAEVLDEVSRRHFLRLAGASLALAAAAGCARQPEEKIVPYVRQPEDVTPGRPLFFATAMTLGGYGLGLLVESHLGRPTKVEGNPAHPASLGATDVFAQAAVLSLYDPDRSGAVLLDGRIASWEAFLQAVVTLREGIASARGDRFRVLTGSVTSPTLAAQMEELLRRFPEARWHSWEPITDDAAREGARLAFGEPVHARYRFDKAEAVLSLEADFLADGPGRVRYARDFMERRRPRPDASMNRLYVAESAPSITGSVADHRLRARSGEIELLARLLAREVGIQADLPPGAAPTAGVARWVGAAARDLKARRGAAVVVAGRAQPPVVHALAHAVNRALGADGVTVEYTDPVEASPVNQGESIRQLAEDLRAGRVESLLILGGNPVYTAPADIGFAEALGHASFSVHLSPHADETSWHCHWHLPEAHFLESWSDVRAFDGTATIVQPLIQPLHGGRSSHEVLAAVLDGVGKSGYEGVRSCWRSRLAGDFERSWRAALHEGVVAGTALPARSVTLREGIGALEAPAPVPAPAPSPSPAGAAGEAGAIEITFHPDPTVWDGRFADNGWLQELPKPLTKVVWDAVAWVSPATAERLRLSSGDLVEIARGGRSALAPLWIVPGQADGSIALHLGYGRTRAGRVGAGVGIDIYPLRTATDLWRAAGASLQKVGTYPVVSRQSEQSMDTAGGPRIPHPRQEGRELVRTASWKEFAANPAFAQEEEKKEGEPTLYPPWKKGEHSWGMTIDLATCIGCSACTIACQAENNIPVVGKEQVARGRAMHWIRVDRYHAGSPDDPRFLHQPVPCMHCENAPCELVCPVGATVHSDEGLNEMVYNRCVGTRYCSNNCPYKVRRFNFFQYSEFDDPAAALYHNPQVTVRSRGVMEKCTYCVQRIEAAKIDARREGRPLRDGEVVTACQQVCPTRAIVFGDIDDAAGKVAAEKRDPRNYGILTALNTRPRTTYLANVRNPNPELEA